MRAFATGLLSSFGHDPTIAIPDFEGEVSLNPESPEQSTLRIAIDATSLTATIEISEKDLAEINRKMHEEVLESGSFPQIVYECSSVSANKMGEGQYRLALNGELTLHGVARSQTVAARVALNGGSLRATGEISIRQSNYAIRPVSAVAGTIRLKDEVKLSFDISARAQR